jgi:uncharacterized membrane protein
MGLWRLLVNCETHECWSVGASFWVISYTQGFSFIGMPTQDVHQVVTDGQLLTYVFIILQEAMQRPQLSNAMETSSS